MDQFDAYFRRADLDGDGRISGAEAVGFFQGSNLPKPVLAQIWTYADQARTGFLGQAEFYNALKLVTVAQSKRELTPDIVKAALYSPAAAKIPPPQINLAAIPAPPQVNSVTAPHAPLMGVVAPTASQNPGFRGPAAPNSSMMSQPSFPQLNQPLRPLQSMPVGSSQPQGVTNPVLSRGGGMVGPGAPNSNNSSDWLNGAKTIGGLGAPTGGVTSAPTRGNIPSLPSFASRSQDLGLTSSLPATKDSKSLVASDPAFGVDLFSVTPNPPKQVANVSAYSAGSAPVPVLPGINSSPKTAAIDSLQYLMRPTGGQQQQPQTTVNPNQHVSAPNISSSASPGMSAGAGNSAINQSQLPWPKMKPSDVQKYTKVFLEVDTDRDGKITGVEARNLFLSWRLPREVLKQVWDLSDQDNDSMLSLREFCIALYLMERFREGQPLPPVLPSNILLDESLLSVTAQTPASYENTSWGPNPGLRQQQGMPGAQPGKQQQGMPGAQPGMHASGLRPPLPTMAPRADRSMQPNLQKSRRPTLDDPFRNITGNEEQTSQNAKLQEALDTEKKGKEEEKVYLDSKEKIEYYRNTMQELVLYKSRCDNRLNEITERALADKREAESLGKKYEEKYKQVGEIASKLTIEEARFRDIQERKIELEQAIVKMAQGGSADGILQVRADRIQSDLDMLIKALTERCKKLGLQIKLTALFELPNGWQPGMQEGAVDWDEDWDKFEDEGFSFNHDMQNGLASTKPQFPSIQVEKGSSNGSITSDGKSERPLHTGEHALENESLFAHSEDDFGRSSPHSPAGRSEPASPSQESLDNHFRKSFDEDVDFNRSFDGSGWGTFDNNDDADSVWGFNPNKESDAEHGESYFFGSGEMGLNPIKTTDSPQSDSGFQSKSPFVFADSVPATPASKYGNSPPRYSRYGSVDNFFDSSSRFDSFSIPDTNTFSPRRETLARFDSMSSTSDFGGHIRFTSFDDSDPFGSTTGPFKVSSDSQNTKRDSGNWNAF